MPCETLRKYLECFKAHGAMPVSLMASGIGAMADFLRDNPTPGEDYCLVNFLGHDAVNIIVFSGSKPAFLRDLYGLSEGDFEGRVKDTIRYSCSRSASKKIDHIYFTGDLKGKEAVMKSLKELEQKSGQASTLSTAATDLSGLNFFKKYVLGPQERGNLIKIIALLLLVLGALDLFIITRSAATLAAQRQSSSRIDAGQYQQALDLQDELRQLSNAK